MLNGVSALLHEAYCSHVDLNLEKKKFLEYGQVFLTLQLLTSRWQNIIMKIAVFLRNCVSYEHKSI